MDVKVSTTRESSGSFSPEKSLDDSHSSKIRSVSPSYVIEPEKKYTVWINVPTKQMAHEPYLVPPTRTPVLIKSKVQVQFGIPGEVQCLKFEDQELDDYKNLLEQKIPDHAIITVTLK